MHKVYIVKAVRSYEIEIIANSEEEAIDYADETAIKEWHATDFEIIGAEIVSENAGDYYLPDTNEERNGLI